MSEQVAIDSLSFAANAQTMHGKILVADLLRLQSALHNSGGTLDYVISGIPSLVGKPGLHCAIRGGVQLTCQRCLTAMDFELSIQSDLVLAYDEVELERYDEQHDEPIDAILADDHLDVLAVIEEEVLLALPMSPRHATACPASDHLAPVNESASKAFAKLAMLKTQK